MDIFEIEFDNPEMNYPPILKIFERRKMEWIEK